MRRATTENRDGRPIRIPIGRATLEGDLEIPEGARGVVRFSHSCKATGGWKPTRWLS
jgi:hypothetical protein